MGRTVRDAGIPGTGRPKSGARLQRRPPNHDPALWTARETGAPRAARIRTVPWIPSPMKHLPLHLIALAASSVTPAAQTGDFQDGELLVWTDDSSGGAATLYRIDAGTGQGVALTGGLSSAYVRPGGFEYDPFRQAILTYTAYEPLGLFSPRLLRIRPTPGRTIRLRPAMRKACRLSCPRSRPRSKPPRAPRSPTAWRSARPTCLADRKAPTRRRPKR